jgi:hypothetical protein
MSTHLALRPGRVAVIAGAASGIGPDNEVTRLLAMSRAPSMSIPDQHQGSQR